MHAEGFDVKVIAPISQQASAAIELLETNENFRYYNQDLGIIRNKEHNNVYSVYTIG